jgi:hypothetical protein
MKFLAFASFLTFVGLGFAVRLSGIAGSWHERVVEIVLAGPDIVQTISALLALVFILVTNLYSRYRRQEYEEWLIRVAQDPSTPPEFKMAILEKFRGRP